jgi:hypothetical protein
MHKDHVFPILGALGGLVTVVLTLAIGTEPPTAPRQKQGVERSVERHDTRPQARAVKLECTCLQARRDGKRRTAPMKLRQFRQPPHSQKSPSPACCDGL